MQPLTLHSWVNNLSKIYIEMQVGLQQKKDGAVDRLISATQEQLDAATHLLSNVNYQVSNVNYQDRTRLRAITTLHKLENSLDKYTGTLKTDDLKNKILGIITTLENTHAKAKDKDANKITIDLPIAFINDLDSDDHNGAMVSGFISFFNEEIPIVTSRSILSCINISDKNKKLEYDKIEQAFIKNKDKYEVYQQCDPLFGEEMILFLPKNLHPDLPLEERFKKLGLTTSGTLKPISFSQALQPPQSKNHLEALFNIFDPNSTSNKLFHISGHGGSGSEGSLGALSHTHVTELLNFLEGQHCCGVTVTSCYAGGKNSFLFRPKEGAKHSFSVLVNSTGEFCTYSSTTPAKIFKKMKVLIETSHNVDTVEKYASMIAKIKKSSNESIYNAAKIYFAHTDLSYLGFYSIGERQTGTPITYRSLQAAKVAKKNEIEIEGALIKIHPLINNLTLKCQKDNPLPISMIAGDSQQYIKELQLNAKDPESYLKQAMEAHKDTEGRNNTSFFISKLNGNGRVLDHVILRSGDMNYCLWKENDQYFFHQRGEKPIHITPLIFELLVFLTREQCKSDPEAIKIASGGQETQELLDKVLIKKSFTAFNTLKSISELNEILSPTSKSKKLMIEQSSIFNTELTPKEDIQLLFFLLNHKEPELALKFLKNKNIDCNAKTFFGSPLILYAYDRKHFDFVDYLLTLPEIDINAKSTDDENLLFRAVHNNQLEFSKSLLDKQINITKNKYGRQPLRYAISPFHPELCKILIQGGCNVNELSIENRTLLWLVLELETNFKSRTEFLECVDFLLENGADPNLGNPSALSLAVRNNDLNLVEKFISHQGNPLKIQPDSGEVPLIEAIKSSSVDMLNFLLSQPNSTLKVKDELSITPLIAAYASGSQEKIELIKLVLEQPLQVDPLYTPSLEILYSRIRRLIAFDEKKELESLLKDEDFLNFLPGIINKCMLNTSSVESSQTTLAFILKCLKNKYISPDTILVAYLKQIENTKNPTKLHFEILNYFLKRDPELSLFATLGESDKTTILKHEQIMAFLFYKSPLFIKNNLEQVILALLSQDKLEKAHEILDRYSDSDQKIELLKKAATITSTSNIRLQTKIKRYLWLLEEGVPPADVCSDKKKLSIFGDIIQSGTLGDVKFCIEQKNALKLPTDFSLLLPLEAAANKHETLEYLVQQGESLDARGHEKYATAFAYIVRHGTLEAFDLALSHHPNVSIVDDTKKTAVQAAAEDHLDKAKIKLKKLISIGADLNSYGTGKPAIISIIEHGDEALIDWCFENGAHLETPELKSLALTAAIASGNERLFDRFIEKGFTMLPQHLAKGKWFINGCKKGSITFVKRLFNQFPQLQSVSNNIKNNLIREIAKSPEGIQLILEEYFDFFAGADFGPCLVWAIQTKDFKFLTLLAEKKILNLRALESHFQSILVDDKLNKDMREPEMLTWLLDHGLDSSMQFADGETLLGTAIKTQYPQGVKLLLERESNPHLICNDSSLLSYAVMYANLEIIELLLDYGAGAELYQKNRYGNDALQFAYNTKNQAILDLFRKKKLLV